MIARALTTCLLLAIFVTAAEARRPYAPGMSCRALQGLMADRGAAVISTGPGTYDRFVTDGRFCERTENTEAEWVPSADRKDCFIGYSCHEHQRDDDL